MLLKVMKYIIDWLLTSVFLKAALTFIQNEVASKKIAFF